MLTPYQVPAGVVATPTKASKAYNWADANLIRWSEDKMTPVGGWTKLAYTAPASKMRAIHTWTVLSGQQYTAYLCEGHLYVDKGDGLVDISPVVPIEQPSSIVAAGGYGDNLYSFDSYGTPRPSRTDRGPITPGYYLDNWGEDLLAMTGTDGRLLRWSPSDPPGTKAAAVTGAPIGNRVFVVTPQRHVILFGAGGQFNREAWCSQENIEDWNYASVTNTAGFYDIEPASPIIAASKAGDEIIFFTAAGDVFVNRYIGIPYIYSYEKIGNGSVPISPNSIEDTPIGCIWPTFNGFWKYDAGNMVPVKCNVWTWITKDANATTSRFNAATVAVNTFSEIWWFFPSAGKIENDHYVIWNYKEGWWSVGRLKRTCGASSTYTDFPLMSDGSNVFQHESGNFYQLGADEELPWVETFSININSGTLLSTFWQMLPDIEGNSDALGFQLHYNIPRTGASFAANMQSEVEYVTEDGYVNFRDTGRDFRLRISQLINGSDPWTMGQSQLDIRPRGGR